MHLIIGSGHMGKMHGSILQELGQKIKYVDIGFDPVKYNYSGHDSVLICSPPQTHVKIINSIPTNIPVFCEKPLLISEDQKIKSRKAPSLMAQNWNWCPHLRDAMIRFYPARLELSYQPGPYGFLDMMHFFGVMDNMFGDNWVFDLFRSDNGDKLTASFISESSLMKIILDFRRLFPSPDSRLNDRKIHGKPCSMFVEQMKYWLDVVTGKTKCFYGFEKAARHNKLLLNYSRRLEN